MSFSFQDYASQSKSSILLIGRPGAGKTVLMSQMPRPYILECDNNIRGPATFIKDLHDKGAKVKLNARFDIPHIIPKGEPGLDGKPVAEDTVVPRSRRFQRFAKLCNAAAVDPEIETLGVDSITTWTDYVLDEVRVQQKKKIAGEGGALSDDPLSKPDWGCFYGVAKNFIINTKSQGKRAIFASHIDTRLDESAQDTQNWMEYIAIPGALREQVAGLFDEVWLIESYAKTTSAGVEYKRRLRTVPADFRQGGLGLKTGLGLGYVFDLDFEQLAAKV